MKAYILTLGLRNVYDGNKVFLIKEIRRSLGLGLREAKDVADSWVERWETRGIHFHDVKEQVLLTGEQLAFFLTEFRRSNDEEGEGFKYLRVIDWDHCRSFSYTDVRDEK